MNLVDTSGWLEYFFEGHNSSFFAKAVEETADLIVSVICLYEVFKKVNLVADEGRALRAIAQMKQGRVIEVSEDIALKASLISIKYRLPLADSLIWTTTQKHEALLWTQDEHFRKLPGVKFP
jgi:predicted nucleic acid-binding protein